ncbi:MAG: hypothetical protein AB8I40_06205 [Anaerolineales bacterium]
MTDKMAVFQLLGEASASIFPLGRDLLRPQFEKYFSEQSFYAPTFLAYQLAPQSLTLELLLKRNPYTNPAVLEEALEGAVQAGYLETDGGGGFQISDAGAAAVDAIHEVFYGHLNQVCQLTEDQLNDLAELLGGLVIATDQADLDGGTLCFDCSYGGLPLVAPSTLGEIDQLLDHLNAFRDDAHIAAWRSTGVSGQVWEALTMIWNGTANTAQKLAETLPYHGYSAGEYQAALDQLVDLGWIKESQEGYQITSKGTKIREKAERDTNTNYFQPWSVLGDPELDQLAELLTKLKESNQSLV